MTPGTDDVFLPSVCTDEDLLSVSLVLDRSSFLLQDSKRAADICRSAFLSGNRFTMSSNVFTPHPLSGLSISFVNKSPNIKLSQEMLQ